MRCRRCGATADNTFLCDQCSDSQSSTALSDSEVDGYLGPKNVGTKNSLDSPKRVQSKTRDPHDQIPRQSLNPYREVAEKIRKEAEASHHLRNLSELFVLSALVFVIWHFHLMDALIPNQFRAMKAPSTIEVASLAVHSAPAEPIVHTGTLRRMYSAGDFENMIRESSKNVLHSDETAALIFESQTQLAKKDPEILAHIHSELLEKIREQSNDYLQRALGWVMLFDHSDPNNFRNGFSLLNGLAQDSSDPYVHAYLGLAYQKLGKMPEARAAWKRALQLDSNIVWLPIHSEKRKKSELQSASSDQHSSQ